MLKVKECDIMINQSKFILKLNLLITKNGFSAVKKAGILFKKDQYSYGGNKKKWLYIKRKNN